jgi:hypothetical protein
MSLSNGNNRSRKFSIKKNVNLMNSRIISFNLIESLSRLIGMNYFEVNVYYFHIQIPDEDYKIFFDLN